MDKFTITIQRHELPQTVNGVLVENGIADFTILLNSGKTEDEQTAAYIHELLHIFHDDFNSRRTVDEIEAERHQEVRRLLQVMS